MSFRAAESTTESLTHRVRAEELARRLATKLTVPTRDVLDSCIAFDAAAEFAALEGLSVGEALRQFVAESMSPCPELGTPGHYGRLPVEPRTVSRLLRTKVERVSNGELEAIAGSDPVLAARLLSTANSAMFASRYEVTRLRESILRLGVPEARRVLVAACMSGIFASKTMQDVWKHCEAVATMASEVAFEAGLDSELAWVAGLLHDIGRVVLSTGSAERQVTEHGWIAAGFPLVYAESLTSGQDHAEVGGLLLKRWDVPTEIVEAVALHHRPECSDSKLVAVVSLAEDLVSARFGTAPEDLWSSMRRVIACQRVGISLDRATAFQTESRVRKSA